MNIQILENHEVNTIIENQSFDHEDFMSMLENPIEGLQKAELPYIFPFKLKQTPGKRHESNSQSFDVLFLDYDDTISAKEAISNFKDFEFYFYTSFNHAVNEGVSKFRIVIPLDKEYPASMWSDGLMKKLVMSQKIFHGVDPNTMKIQGYYAPAINPNGKYFSHYNKGSKFSLNPFISLFKKLMMDRYVEDYRKEQKVTMFGPSTKCVRSFKFNTPVGEKTVNEWLTTSFISKSGNVWSELGLFNCLRLCKRYQDEETKNLVYNKALSEGWDRSEINKKWNSIKEK